MCRSRTRDQSDLLVKVKAAGSTAPISPAAKAKPAMSKPIGIEFAGEVVAIGARSTALRRATASCAMPTGSHAEFALTDYRRALKIPEGMSFEQAATLPVGLNTLHNALITAGRLKAGDNVLVQGASSGVGIIGLQMAKLLGAKLRDRNLDQRGPARAAQGIWRGPRAQHRAMPTGRSRCPTRPGAAASI